MSKEVTMTIRVEPSLRSRFSEAATSQHRPAAQVLRDLMREYVERTAPVQPPNSVAERQLREKSVSYGIASVALEGFSVPDEYRKEAERYIRGEIDFPALTDKMYEVARNG